MTFKRRVLSALGKAELLELGRALELDVKTAMAVAELRAVLANSKRARLERLVTTDLDRDTLKAICETCGLDSKSKEKQPLVDRILAAARGDRDDDAPAPQPGLALPKVDDEAIAAARASQATTPRAPRANRGAGGGEGDAKVLSYRHRERRVNNPEVGMVGPETDPQQPRTPWHYDPHIDPALQFDTGRAQVENLIDHALASNDEAAMRAALEQLRRQAQPYLNWAGKAERTSFEVDTVSLHVHERIDPASILAAVRKGAQAGQALGTSARERPVQFGLFSAPFENLPLRDAIDFYKHDKGWSNRLIAGDSLLVMNSLLQKEGMAGQVQMIYIDPPYGIRYGSNFQPFVNKRDVKDRSDADLTQEPETLKAFRDTWALGIHSYLTYLGDRLLLARDLLSETGSIFVQISDENVHLVRNLLDEIFGVDRFICELLVKKKGSQKSTMIDPVNDYVIWYGKSPRAAKKTKFHPVFVPREIDADTLDEFSLLELPSGRVMNLRDATTPDGEAYDYRLSPARLLRDYPGGKLFRPWPITNGGLRPNQGDDVEYQGAPFPPPRNRCWSFRSRSEPGVDHVPMTTLGKAGRLWSGDKALDGKRYLENFPFKSISNWWDGLGGASGQIYVVQTNEEIVQRCLLMTTDPSDLVFDPTCGSGTTATVAEKWGRRWITCDTSRIAITLAKQRLMTASFAYYQLKYPHEGLKGGFNYETTPHVMLNAVANDPEIDDLHARHHPEVETSLADLNAALSKQPPATAFEIAQGVRAGERLDLRSKGATLSEWEVPFEFPTGWPSRARAAFDAFHAARQTPPPKPSTQVQSLVSRNHLELRWPNVVRIETVVRPTLIVDWTTLEPLVLDPSQIPTAADLAAVVGGATDGDRGAQIDLEQTPEAFRLQCLVFRAAQKAFNDVGTRFTGRRQLLMFQLVRLVERFLASDRLQIPSVYHRDPPRRRILFAQSLDRIVGHLMRAVTEQNREHTEPIFDEDFPIGSTREMRTWYTTKPCEATGRSQISHMIADSAWEQHAANLLETSPLVVAYAKNDHLGFQVHYLWQGGRRRYLPDFLVRLTNGITLVLEIKGEVTDQSRAKAAALRLWVEAVNAKGGFGRWSADVVDDPATLHDVLARHARP